MTKEEDKLEKERFFTRELDTKGLNDPDSFMIAYYVGSIVPRNNPNYGKYKINIDIRKNKDGISGEIGFDAEEYELNEETVNKLYSYVEKHIDTLKELNDNQVPDEIDGGGGPLRIKYKLEKISLKVVLASEIDKMLVEAIIKDIVRIIKETSKKK